MLVCDFRNETLTHTQMKAFELESDKYLTFQINKLIVEFYITYLSQHLIID